MPHTCAHRTHKRIFLRPVRVELCCYFFKNFFKFTKSINRRLIFLNGRKEVLLLNAGAAGVVHMFTIPMERIGTIKVMYRATPVARARVKAKTIYQPGFVVQLQRRRQRIGFKTQQHNANTMCCS